MNQLADVIDDQARNGDSDPCLVEQGRREWEFAVDLLPQVICLLDAGGRILRINRTAEAWNLGKVQMARGLSLHQFLHPGCNDSRCALRDFWLQARTQLQNGGQSAYRADDPALQRHIEIIARGFRQPVGRWRLRRRIFAVVQVGDVSWAKRREARLRGQCADLRRQIEATRAQFRQARELLSQLIDGREEERKRLGAMRQLAIDWRSSVPGEPGFLSTVDWFVGEFRASYPDIVVDLEIGVGEADIPERLKTVIYRILRDALHHIARPGGRAAICVRLGLFGGTLELVIEDSGPVDAEKGQDFGLVSIRDRAYLSGGDYQVISWAGQGTLIRVRWPLD